MPKVIRILNRFNLGGPTYNAAYLTKYLEPEFNTILVGGQKDDSEDNFCMFTKALDDKHAVMLVREHLNHHAPKGRSIIQGIEKKMEYRQTDQ